MFPLASPVTPDTAVAAATVVVSGGTAIHAIELLAMRREFGAGGLYSWDGLRTFRPITLEPRWQPVFDAVLDARGYRLLIAVQLAAALVAMARPGSREAPWALGVMVVIQLLWHFRNPLGLNSADQMRILVPAACIAYAAAPDPWAKQACLWFVCLQTVLAYVTAGLVKWGSPVWRDGTAMMTILRTRTFGARLPYAIVTRFPAVALALCWGTIVFECALPVLIFCGPTACLVFVTIGLAFHVSIALTMGLNDFVWAYVSTYPIVLYCAFAFDRWRQALFA